MDRLDRESRDWLATYHAGDRMPAAQRDAAWARLQAAAATDDPDERLASATRERRRTIAWGLVLLAAAAVLLVVGKFTALGERDGDDARQQAVHAADGPERAAVQNAAGRRATIGAPPVAEDMTDRPADAPGADTTAAGSPAAPPSARPARRPASDDPADLDAELALLRRARAALAEGRPADALTLLAEHARRFATGLLGEEAALLRVQALCETGARDQARAEAQAFARARPDSSHAKRIVRLCSEQLVVSPTAGK
jgi:hypothetical protein